MDHYVIRVDGPPLPDDALKGFEGLSVAPQAVHTVLHGDLAEPSPALADSPTTTSMAWAIIDCGSDTR